MLYNCKDWRKCLELLGNACMQPFLRVRNSRMARVSSDEASSMTQTVQTRSVQ
jgi:hypothetical protein